MSLRNKKLFAGFVGATLAIALIAGVGATANAAALTSAQISAIISLLQSFGADQATINNVNASLSGGTPAPTTPSSGTGYTFTRDLKQGDTGADVMNLQKVLNMDAATMVASSGVGSPGNETSYFGPATKAAVIKFQNKYASETLTPVGLSSGTGYVGAMTRAKLNSMGGVVIVPPGTTPPPAVGTGLTVSDPGQPGVSLAPQSAARLPFTKIRVTAGNDGDVTVNSITVERTGLAQDVVFSGVVLIDENGLQLGDAKTFNSNHQATIGIPFTVKAGTSRVLTVAGNMGSSLGSYAGQVATLTVVSVNTNGAVVSGTLPITGAAQTINATLTLGSVTLGTSSFDPNSGVSKEVGTTAYKFTGFRLTAGSAEKIRLWSVRWYQSGSVASGDLANVQTYVDGVAYPVTVSTDGKYYTALFPGGILMDKGNSVDIWVSGDIVGTSAAGRTVQFDVFKTTDVYLTGETYGYGVTPPVGSGTVSSGARTATTFTTGNPWIESSTVTVTAGSATSITKSPAVAAQNIAVAVPNQPLGGFETDIKGEAISVQSLVFHFQVTGSGGQVNDLTNITIVDQNGAVVAGPVDAATAAAYGTATFTDTITFPIGKRVYTLKGKVGTDFTNNQTIVASSTPSSDWTNVTGMITGNSITLTNGAFSMNTMTVKSGALTITVAPTPSAQTIVAGGTERLFANYQLDASQSGEDIRISSMKAQLTFATGDDSELSGCRLYDGGNALNSTVVDTASANATPNEYTFTFDQALVIPKQTVKTLALKCNVSTSATNLGEFSWGITNTAANITPTGVVSGSEITESVTAATGQTMTIGTGSLAVTEDTSSPSYSVVAGGTTGQVVGVYRFVASNEAMNLTRLGLSLTNTASSTPSDLTNVTIWDGGTQVGSVQFTGSANAVATSTFNTPVTLTKDVPKLLTIKADVGSIGPNQPAYEGHLIAIDFNSAQASGLESGSTREASGSTSVDGIRIFKSYPVITYVTTGGTAISGAQTLLNLSITASGNDVTLNKLTFKVATTTADLTSPTFTGPNGNVASTTLATALAGTTGDAYLTVYFDSTTNTADKTIAAGTTKNYTLGGTIALTGSSNTVGSVSVALRADTAFPAVPSSLVTGTGTTTNAYMASTTQTSLAASNIIWSPMTTTTPTTSANDWTNGYGLPGCFTSSGLGQNCAARVISK